MRHPNTEQTATYPHAGCLDYLKSGKKRELHKNDRPVPRICNSVNSSATSLFSQLCAGVWLWTSRFKLQGKTKQYKNTHTEKHVICPCAKLVVARTKQISVHVVQLACTGLRSKEILRNSTPRKLYLLVTVGSHENSKASPNATLQVSTRPIKVQKGYVKKKPSAEITPRSIAIDAETAFS